MVNALEMILQSESLYESSTAEEIQIFWAQLPYNLQSWTLCTAALFLIMTLTSMIVVILANLKKGRSRRREILLMSGFLLSLNCVFILFGPSFKTYARIIATMKNHESRHAEEGSLLELKAEPISLGKTTARYYLKVGFSAGEDRFRISRDTHLAVKDSNSVSLICYGAKHCWIERDRQELRQYVWTLGILSAINLLLLIGFSFLIWLWCLELRKKTQAPGH